MGGCIAARGAGSLTSLCSVFAAFCRNLPTIHVSLGSAHLSCCQHGLCAKCLQSYVVFSKSAAGDGGYASRLVGLAGRHDSTRAFGKSGHGERRAALLGQLLRE